MSDKFMLGQLRETGEWKIFRDVYNEELNKKREICDPLDCIKVLLDNDFKFTLSNKFELCIGDLQLCNCWDDSKSWKNYRKKRTGTYSDECKWMGRRDLKDNSVLAGNVLCPDAKYEVYRFMYDVIGLFVKDYNKQNDLNMSSVAIYTCICGMALLNLANEKVDITKDTLTRKFILQNGREFMDKAAEILKADFSDVLQQIYNREIKVKVKER